MGLQADQLNDLKVGQNGYFDGPWQVLPVATEPSGTPVWKSPVAGELPQLPSAGTLG